MNDLKAFRPASLLSRIGGDNCYPSFSYWNLSTANLVRLCDISKRKKDWTSYFKRTSSLLSKTLDLRKREEVRDGLCEEQTSRFQNPIIDAYAVLSFSDFGKGSALC